MDISKLKEKKKELGYTNKQLSELTGVPVGTIQKIFGSETKAPRRETYLALAEVLDPEGAYEIRNESSYVREEALAYNIDFKEKKQGEYTIEDYYALPDDRRAELIDGVIYDMTAPGTVHQVIAGEVYHQIRLCADAHKVDCYPFISPIDVQLDRDNRTMVEPDVIIICDRSLVKRRVVFGAPEFVMEVLSPSTRGKDQLIKLNKYFNAGCREVWIVDPENDRILAYDFRKETWPDIYTFDDKVPVAVSEGRCEVDFSEIKEILDINITPDDVPIVWPERLT